jgi:hypothetical protein
MNMEISTWTRVTDVGGTISRRCAEGGDTSYLDRPLTWIFASVVHLVPPWRICWHVRSEDVSTAVGDRARRVVRGQGCLCPDRGDGRRGAGTCWDSRWYGR